MANRVTIAAIGSLSDLNAFTGIGQALAARGAAVLVAVPADQLHLVRRAADFRQPANADLQHAGRAD